MYFFLTLVFFVSVGKTRRCVFTLGSFKVSCKKDMNWQVNYLLNYSFLGASLIYSLPSCFIKLAGTLWAPRWWRRRWPIAVRVAQPLPPCAFAEGPRPRGGCCRPGGTGPPPRPRGRPQAARGEKVSHVENLVRDLLSSIFLRVECMCVFRTILINLYPFVWFLE